MEASPSKTLLSPPRGWPACFSSAVLQALLTRELAGRRVRLCGRPSAADAALLAGLELEGSSLANAERVRRHTGWSVLGGYALYERAAAAAPSAPASERYVAQLRYWNAKADGTWLDATPRSDAQLVLVESPKAPLPSATLPSAMLPSATLISATPPAATPPAAPRVRCSSSSVGRIPCKLVELVKT